MSLFVRRMFFGVRFSVFLSFVFSFRTLSFMFVSTATAAAARPFYFVASVTTSSVMASASLFHSVAAVMTSAVMPSFHSVVSVFSIHCFFRW